MFKKLPVPYWYFVAAFIGISSLFALRTYTYSYADGDLSKWGKYSLIHSTNFFTWLLLVPFVYQVISRYNLKSDKLSHRTIAILVSLGMALLHELLSNIIFYVPYSYFGHMESNAIIQRVIKLLPTAVINRLLEYWVLYGLLMGIDYQRLYRKKELELANMEKQLTGAQLNALRYQLQPHFLFNTLNTISSLADIDALKAQNIISKLGKLLRALLDKEASPYVSLDQEIAFIRNYLDIEQTRFQDRLDVQYDIAEDCRNLKVPSLMLQPVVENAIKHGFANKQTQGKIILRARIRQDMLIIQVIDDGMGTDTRKEQLLEEGIGLKNLKERLTLLYGANHELSIQSEAGHGFALTISLPKSTIL